MEDLYQVPNQAVLAFEKMTGLQITLHDLGGRFHGFLPHQRFTHQAPLCLAVKASKQDSCTLFDAQQTHKALRELPQGRVQVCHAGLVEFVAPLYRAERLEGVLFAGQRMPGRLPDATRDPNPPTRPAPWRKDTPLPPRVDDAEAAAILEMLRQLAARLTLWRDALERNAGVPPVKTGVRGLDQASRGAVIRRFVHGRHWLPLKLADLAGHLNISESRAGHAVREACGQPFIQLLTEARLQTAASLLQYTNLSVLEVAARSGFGDLSNFHAAFRKKFGTTPYKYRGLNQAKAVV